MNQISFIYFDIGGVVVLDFSKTNKWDEMLRDLGLNAEQKAKFSDLFGDFEPRICNGEDLDLFVKTAKEQLKISFPENYSMLNDFVNRFEHNLALVPLLQKLSAKFNLGLLTNMYPEMLNKIKEKGLLPEVNWHSIIDSSNVGVSKPDPEIYEIAEQAAETKPGNILFVENTQKNIDAAKLRGWQTLLYDPSKIQESNEKLERLVL